MRMYRVSFVGGLAIGYVLGAQAGRERYDQLRELARKAAENPAMQQAAGALQAQAASTARSARDLASSGVRKGASKVGRRGSATTRPGSKAPAAQADGSGPRTGSEQHRPFVPVNGSMTDHGPM